MTQKKAIVRLGIPSEAGSLFKHALVHPRSKEMLTIRNNPTLALTALQSGDEALGINARTSADILEEVVENQPIDKAKELMKLHLTKERLVQLLAARGDLDSTAALYADAGVLIAAIDAVLSERLAQYMMEGGDEAESEDVSLAEPDQIPEAPEFDTVCRWAYKLKDRQDYLELLNAPLCGGSTSMRFILAQGFLDEIRNQPAPSSRTSQPKKEDDDDTLRDAAYRQAFIDGFFPERACVLLGIDGVDNAESLVRIVEEEARLRTPVSRRAARPERQESEDQEADKVGSNAVEDAHDATAEVQDGLDID